MSELSGRDAVPEPILKGLDAWWTVLAIDPIATRMARRLLPFSAITPSGLTVAAHLLGLVSAVAFATGHLLWGAVLFELRFVLDCADGKLARLRGVSSATGAYLDYVGDYLVVAANMAGLGLHLQWVNELSPVIVVALPAAFLAHVTAGQARDGEVLAAGFGYRPAIERLPGGYRSWMARRRLRSSPSRIEAEHLLLFAAPLAAWALDADRFLAGVAAAVTLYFCYRTARIAIGGYRIAAERDRLRSTPT